MCECVMCGGNAGMHPNADKPGRQGFIEVGLLAGRHRQADAGNTVTQLGV